MINTMQQEINTPVTNGAENTVDTTIDIVSVTKSSTGSYMMVTLDGKTYNSSVTEQELDESKMQELMLEVYEQVPNERVQEVKAKFEEFIQSIANTKAELEYRELHPEEFLHEHSDDMLYNTAD